jgi:hypothetical protein
MCPNCDIFAQRLRFSSSADYVAFVRRLINEVSKGNLVLVYGDCALEDLADAPPWPAGDTILHEVQCTTCGQFFQLCVNVWNGRNSWEPQSPEEWARESTYYIKLK